MGISRWIALAAVVCLLGAVFQFDLGSYLTLENIKSEQEALQALVKTNPAQFIVGYFLIYVAVTALSIPGAAVMTLVAGALFGLWWGLLIVSFASTIGATLAMVMARWLFKEQVESRFKNQISTINKGIEKDGAFYLFTLRLVPAFPFFAINLAMALTSMNVITFFLVSQVGMLAGTFVFVNAGTELAQVNSPSDVLSAGLLMSFVLLGLFPLFAKWFVDWVRAQRVYRRFKKPKSFDTDMVVIGAGSGGLVAALIAATVKAKVTLIEKNKMGGDCLNTGCVPSKALIRSARHAYDNSRGASLGFSDSVIDVDFKAIMGRVQRTIAEIEPHDSVERYQGLGVDVEIGEGEVVSPWHVRVNGKTISTRNIVIASGAEPFVPPIENLNSIDYLTSNNLWELQERPARVVVLGLSLIHI